MAQLKLRNPFEDTAAPATSTSAATAKSPAAPKLVRRPADNELAADAQPDTGGEAPQQTIRLSVDLERPLHRRLRRWALERDQTASDVIRELLTSALDGAGY
jgi:hypothetical protein